MNYPEKSPFYFKLGDYGNFKTGIGFITNYGYSGMLSNKPRKTKRWVEYIGNPIELKNVSEFDKYAYAESITSSHFFIFNGWDWLKYRGHIGD